MPYCYRLRVRMAVPFDTTDSNPSIFPIGLASDVEARVDGDAHPHGKWVSFVAKGYDTGDAARTDGRHFVDLISAAGAIGKLGIDVGQGRTENSHPRRWAQRIEAMLGPSLSDHHGLMVYEEGSRIFRAEAKGVVSRDPNFLKQQLARWPRSWAMTERQRNCAEFLNDSFFAASDEGRFVLRISAVEALCDQRELHEDYRTAIATLTDHLTGMECPTEVRKTLGDMLNRAGKQSIRQAYLTKFRALLGPTEAKSFDKLYDTRSDLLHDGKGRGTLAQQVEPALDLAARLLEADLSRASY